MSERGVVTMSQEKDKIQAETEKKAELTQEEKERLMEELFRQLDGCAGCPGCCGEE